MQLLPWVHSAVSQSRRFCLQPARLFRKRSLRFTALAGLTLLLANPTILVHPAFSNEALSNETPSAEAIAPDPLAPEPSPLASPLPPSPTPLVECQTQPVLASYPASTLTVSSGLKAWVEGLMPKLMANFAPPFPQIHGAARLSSVPVMMYHDILAEKQVFFDVTPEEFEAHLQLIRQNGLTPISLDRLVEHLRTGIPLPEKPILLTFDDGYAGHYTYVYPLLKQYGYPGLFSIYPQKVGTTMGRSSLTWEQVKEMAADPNMTIAGHSFTHPSDLTQLPDDRLQYEVAESKRELESQLGMPIRYFVYPEGRYDERVQRSVEAAGYLAALTMRDDEINRFAGESETLLSIERVGQSQLQTVVPLADRGVASPSFGGQANFTSPVRMVRRTVGEIPLILVSGGQPTTVHADSRYQVSEILAKTEAVAAVDGGFFSLEHLHSNAMIGPVLSRNTQEFVAANPGSLGKISGRPLVLIGPDQVKFIPFDPAKHNDLAGVQAEMPNVTDVFVAAAWLIKDGQPQPVETFSQLLGFDAMRDRAFWGVDYAGQPVIGVTSDHLIDAVGLSQALGRSGLREVVMLDSGASTSLSYMGESMMSFEPRPVPHIVALLPPQPVAAAPDCTVMSQNAPALAAPAPAQVVPVAAPEPANPGQ